MTKETAKYIWKAKYGKKPFTEKMKWDEIEARLGLSKTLIQQAWNRYGIKELWTRKGHPQPTKITDEEIVDRLTVDNTH